MKRKIIPLALAFVMMLSLLPLTVYADDPNVGDIIAVDMENAGFHCTTFGGNGRVKIDGAQGGDKYEDGIYYFKYYGPDTSGNLVWLLIGKHDETNGEQYEGNPDWWIAPVNFICPNRKGQQVCHSNEWFSFSNMSGEFIDPQTGVISGKNIQLNHGTPADINVEIWLEKFIDAYDNYDLGIGAGFVFQIFSDHDEYMGTMSELEAGLYYADFPHGLTPGEYYIRETYSNGYAPIWSEIWFLISANGQVFWLDVDGEGEELNYFINETTDDPPTHPTPANVELKATKTVNPSGSSLSWSFDFELYESDLDGRQGDKLGTTKRAVSGNPVITFDPLEFLSYGTYYFLVKETSTSGSGWAIDPKVCHVQVKVEESENELSPSLIQVQYRSGSEPWSEWSEYNDNAIVFQNIYTSTEPQDTSSPPPSYESPPSTESSPSSEEPTPSSDPSPSSEPPPTISSEPPPDNGDDGENPPDLGGRDPFIPPNPTVPGNNLEVVLDDDGIPLYYIEFDEDGTPLGEWHWDDDEDMWLFDEYPPLADFPATGLTTVPLYFTFLFGLILISFGISIRRKNAYIPKHLKK